MNRITTFNRAACAAVLDLSLPALAAAVAPLGIKVERESGRFDGDTFTARFKFIAAGAEPARTEFERWAAMYGATAEDYGREFTWGGETYRVAGLSVNRPKFPFDAVRVRDGKRFKFPKDVVTTALKGSPA